MCMFKYSINISTYSCMIQSYSVIFNRQAISKVRLRVPGESLKIILYVRWDYFESKHELPFHFIDSLTNVYWFAGSLKRYSEHQYWKNSARKNPLKINSIWNNGSQNLGMELTAIENAVHKILKMFIEFSWKSFHN